MVQQVEQLPWRTTGVLVPCLPLAYRGGAGIEQRGKHCFMANLLKFVLLTGCIQCLGRHGQQIILCLAFIPSYLKSLTILLPSIIVADIMETILFAFFACILLLSRDRNLLIENLALRQQIAIMKQKNKRPKIRSV